MDVRKGAGMTYVTYRVKDANGRPGAVVCRPHTDEEREQAKQSPFVLGAVEVFEAEPAADRWPLAHRALGLR